MSLEQAGVSSDGQWVRVPSVSRPTPDGLLVLALDGQAEIQQLNLVGEIVWERLAQPATLTDLLKAVAMEADTEVDVWHDQVLSFVGQLSELGLIYRSPSN